MAKVKSAAAKPAKAKAPSAARVQARTQTGPFDLPLTGKITVANPNAKNPGSKGGKRFGLYRNGMSVQAYLDASTKAGNRAALAKADLMWDFNHEFITVTGHSLKPLGAPARGRAAVVSEGQSASA